MRFVKAVFMIALWVPCFARANGGDVSVANMLVPVSRIDNAVQSYLDLHDSVFVFLLRDKISDNDGYITLGELAQLCVNFLGKENIVTCQKFMRDVIGGVHSSVKDWQFTAKFHSDGEIKFKIAAAGVFDVDCGDNDSEHIERDNADVFEIICANTSEIKISGLATGYSDDEDTPVINFRANENLTKVSGSLGKIFPTINGVSPRFVGTFWECENLTDITGLSFENITVGAKNMFWGTFGKTGITSIPVGLFSGLTNASAERMFAMTFYGCDKLESIPEDLFKNVDVQESLPDNMFLGTFANCSNVKSMGPMIDKKHLYQILDWGKDKTACFCGAENMSGYGEIPYAWK